MTLEPLLLALGRDDIERSIELALDAWSKHPTDALADAVVQIFGLIPVPPVDEADIDAWLERDANRDLLDLPRQLAELHAIETVQPGHHRLFLALADWPANPYIAHELVAWITSPEQTYLPSLELAVEIAARAATNELRATLRALPWRREPKKRLVEKQIAALVDTEQPPDTLGELRDAIASCIARRTNRTHRADDLLAAIYDKPDDTALRIVLADHWSEAGDPRGEFIALQGRDVLDDDQRARVDELLDAHWEEWLAPLGPGVFERDGITFTRGFLSRATTFLEGDREPYIGHPIWQTLEHASLTLDSDITELLHPTVRQLRTIDGIRPEHLYRIAKLDHALPLESLELPANLYSDYMSTIGANGVLPALREIRDSTPNRYYRDWAKYFPALERMVTDRFLVPDTRAAIDMFRTIVGEAGDGVWTLRAERPTELELHVTEWWFGGPRFYGDLGGITLVRISGAPSPKSHEELERYFGVRVELTG
ncbi:MAG: TIGR02996 domain-containing protein [Kofleriaceae bacterium]